MAEWIKDPVETGAYWAARFPAGAELCWIHEGRIWFAPTMPLDFRSVFEYQQYGFKFMPIERPAAGFRKCKATKKAKA